MPDTRTRKHPCRHRQIRVDIDKSASTSNNSRTTMATMATMAISWFVVLLPYPGGGSRRGKRSYPP
eukprot:4265321-Heterocapsa_arctica.AAC.1